jgi:hypothetical protein
MKRSKIKVVKSPELWEILVSPVRSHIAETLRLLGPSSVAQVAAAIGRPPDGLYRHIEMLIEAGFVRQTGFRKSERNVERIIDVVAQDFRLELDKSGVNGRGGGSGDSQRKAQNRAVVMTARSFIAEMARTVRKAGNADILRFHESERNISINYELSWLSRERYQQVRELIRQLKAIMDEGKKTRTGDLYSTLAIACPVRPARATRGQRPHKALQRAEPSKEPTGTALRATLRRTKSAQLKHKTTKAK